MKTLLGRLRMGELVDSFETQRLTKDGRTVDVWLTLTKLADETGETYGIATTERDISRRRRDESEKEDRP